MCSVIVVLNASVIVICADLHLQLQPIKIVPFYPLHACSPTFVKHFPYSPFYNKDGSRKTAQRHRKEPF